MISPIVGLIPAFVLTNTLSFMLARTPNNLDKSISNTWNMKNQTVLMERDNHYILQAYLYMLKWKLLPSRHGPDFHLPQSQTIDRLGVTIDDLWGEPKGNREKNKSTFDKYPPTPRSLLVVTLSDQKSRLSPTTVQKCLLGMNSCYISTYQLLLLYCIMCM